VVDLKHETVVAQPIEVHRYWWFDPTAGESKVQPSKRTAENINQIGGEIIPGTAETVDASQLDEQGRYYPPGDAAPLPHQPQSDPLPWQAPDQTGEQMRAMHEERQRGFMRAALSNSGSTGPTGPAGPPPNPPGAVGTTGTTPPPGEPVIGPTGPAAPFNVGDTVRFREGLTSPAVLRC